MESVFFFFFRIKLRILMYFCNLCVELWKNLLWKETNENIKIIKRNVLRFFDGTYIVSRIKEFVRESVQIFFMFFCTMI